MTKKIVWKATTFLLFAFLLSCQQEQKSEEFLIERARIIHENVLTVDTHADTPMLMARGEWKMGERHNPDGQRMGKIDLPRMKEGGMDAVFFAAYVAQGDLTEEGYLKAKNEADRLIGAVHKMCSDYPDLVELALTLDDAYRLEKEGKRAAFLGLENGYPIGRNIALVEEFYDKGVRYITLSHSGDNDICDSSTDEQNPEDRGLSEFGRMVVKECNRLGIMVDVSHVSDKTFFDVLEVSKAPVIASHSSVRALCDHPRNLSDSMLQALAAKGGVIQVCLVSSFLKKQTPNPERDAALKTLREKYGSWSEVRDEAAREKMFQEYGAIMRKYPGDRATLQDLADHIDYVVKLIGVDHVGIGTDFDGGGEIQGCEEVSQMSRITEELCRRGYSDEDIRKIWGGNLMRVFREVEKTAQRDDPGLF